MGAGFCSLYQGLLHRGLSVFLNESAGFLVVFHIETNPRHMTCVKLWHDENPSHFSTVNQEIIIIFTLICISWLTGFYTKMFRKPMQNCIYLSQTHHCILKKKKIVGCWYSTKSTYDTPPPKKIFFECCFYLRLQNQLLSVSHHWDIFSGKRFWEHKQEEVTR